MEESGNLLLTLQNWAMTTGLKLIIALIVLFISFKIINSICRKVEKHMVQKMDKTLSKTFSHVIRVGAKIVVLTCLVGYLGIDTSGMAAVIGSLGVCAGLAVNGALSNLAGGVLILITRPFKIGDYIEAQGVEGVVEDINIVATKVVTLDNKVLYIPNGALSGGNIMNYSEKELRRVDLEFSIAGNNPDTVRQLLLDVCANESKIVKDPSYFVRVTDYGAGNGVKITLRAWTQTQNYWDTRFDLLESVRTSFEKNNIVIPFNQLDVHIKNN